MSEDTTKDAPLVETDEAGDEASVEQSDIEAAREHIDKVQTEAKEQHSLRDRIKRKGGIKQRTAKVVLFFDLEAMQTVAAAKNQADLIFAQAERSGIEDERRTALLDEHDKALDEYEAAKEALAEHIGVAHLTTVPGPQVARAVRKARRRIEAIRTVMLERQADESESDEQREMAAEWVVAEGEHFETEMKVQMLAIGMLSKVVFSDEEITVFDPQDIREVLLEQLPANQWAELASGIEQLMFDEQIARAAVEEPGFSQGN